MKRLLLVIACLAASLAEAQRAPIPTIEAADSALAAGDSAGALAMYAARVKADRRDGVAWYKQGMLAWQMAKSGQGKGMMKQKDVQLLSLADTALRLATQISRDSARYHLTLGRFLLQSNVMTMRMAAYNVFEEGLEAAKRVREPLELAAAADEVGMVSWRRYEALANRRELRGTDSLGIDPSNQDPDEIRNYIENFTMKLRAFPGEGDYRKALEHFELALKSQPGYPRALRHLFMAHAELNNWEELKRVAKARTETAPWDPQGWLALGLAAHRLNEEQEAGVAFDSAMKFISEEDLKRYNDIARIVRPGDSTAFKASDADAKNYTTEKYWVLSDPLWLTPHNEHRLEFLSRVTFADIRWTSDEFNMLGADTDRGDVHIRYGPPDVQFSTRGGSFNELTTTWMYRSGMTFIFVEPPTWGTARHNDPEHIKRLAQVHPVRWDNVATDRRTDSVRVQLSRFRSTADSVDILMVARIPIDSIMRGVDLRQAPVDIDFQMFNDVFKRVARDSSRHMVTPGEPSGAEMRAWRKRIPKGAFFYRVEAHQPDAVRGARATGNTLIGRDTSFALSGFGISDIVVANQVSPRAGAAARWSDFNIVPGVGQLKQGQSIALLWETYALGVVEGSNRYKVEVSLTKLRREGAIGMAARIVGGVSGAVGATDKGKGKVTLKYDRNIPATDAAVDYLTVDLGTAPTGRYTLRVDVVDTVTGRRVSRERPVSIVQ